MKNIALALILSILAVTGIYLVMKSVQDKRTTEEEIEYTSEEINKCYQAALDCRKHEYKCSKCFSACSDIKNNEVKDNALHYCKLGKAEKILNLTG